MPEALILPPRNPDIEGLVVVNQELDLAQEFGMLATSIINDPTATKKDAQGNVIYRVVESAGDPSVTIETRIERKPVIVKNAYTGKGKVIRKKNREHTVQVRSKMNAMFIKDIIEDPTLKDVDYEGIILRVVELHGEMTYQIAKKDFGDINLDDPFLQHLLDYFRRHIKAKNC